MHANAELLTRLYSAFKKLDYVTMRACYQPDATFSDAVFTDLRGPQVTGMWEMLCKAAKDFDLTFRDVSADDTHGSAHWEPTYTFSRTGRRVHNVIDAKFTFRDGLIQTHRDDFSLRLWMGMALGTKGKFLGWIPQARDKVRATARAGLDKFLTEKRE